MYERHYKVVDGHIVRGPELLPFNGKDLDQFVDDSEKDNVVALPERTSGGTGAMRPALTTGLSLADRPEYQEAIPKRFDNNPEALSVLMGILKDCSSTTRLPLSSMNQLVAYAEVVAEYHKTCEEIEQKKPMDYYESNAGYRLPIPPFKKRTDLKKEMDKYYRTLKLGEIKKAVYVRSRKKPKFDPEETK